MSEYMPSVLERELREAGLRVTSQRLQVFKIVSESDAHLSAEDIHVLVREQDGDASLATVYRTLKVLREAGLVAPHYLGKDHEKEHFEPSSKPEHFHFTCHRCGQVFEFETELVNALKTRLRKDKGWVLGHACMCLEGLCSDCKTMYA
ncbi:MAG: Fur family transcriptional regulator [Anaerolineales bacterium]|nr:Fur family transcriptional regulator [Anaerolineales bacterium]